MSYYLLHPQRICTQSHLKLFWLSMIKTAELWVSFAYGSKKLYEREKPPMETTRFILIANLSLLSICSWSLLLDFNHFPPVLHNRACLKMHLNSMIQRRSGQAESWKEMQKMFSILCFLFFANFFLCYLWKKNFVFANLYFLLQVKREIQRGYNSR